MTEQSEVEPDVVVSWNDEAAVLMCRRGVCMVPYRHTRTSPIRMVQWEADISNMTPEQVIEVRDKHVEDGHR